jgi:hypothetical protein
MRDEALRIDIGSEFVGAKAFRAADTATSALTRQVNNLAKSYLGLYGIQKLARGAGAAARAFAEDDKAAKVLGQTLTNLGLGFGDNARIVNNYISNLEKQTGVLDDELRPAMDRLLRATGDITKSQKLLSLALDISAGTGKTLTQVSQSLQKGFLGQTQALGRLGVGLSKAELTSSSFEEIQTRLAVLFEGQAAMAAETYIGKMNKLTVAANNAKEIIGEGLFDALAATGGGGEGGFDTFTKSVEGASKAVAYLAKLVGTNLGILSLFLTGRPGSATDLILGRTPAAPSTGVTPQIAAELKKAAAEKASAKARAALTKTTKEQTKAIKEQTALQKAGTLFDLEQTSIIAALKGKISDEERTRLELQLAILTGNTAEASKLAGQLAKSQGLTAELVAYLKNLPDAKNPFSAWANYLDAIQAQVAKIATGGMVSAGAAGAGRTAIVSNAANINLGDMTDFIPRDTGQTAFRPAAVNVIVTLDGQELTTAVSNVQTNNSLSGNKIAINRRSGSFAATPTP